MMNDAMTTEEAEREADRLLALLDVGLEAVKRGDGDAALLTLQEALATAERMPKKVVIDDL